MPRIWEKDQRPRICVYLDSGSEPRDHIRTVEDIIVSIVHGELDPKEDEIILSRRPTNVEIADLHYQFKQALDPKTYDIFHSIWYQNVPKVLIDNLSIPENQIRLGELIESNQNV